MRRCSVIVALAALGCSPGTLTEILVVVDSDLAVPSEIDSIEIDAMSPSGRMEHASVALDGADALGLPISVGLVHGGGPLGPIDVTARALLGASEVVERRGVVSFIPGRTVVLRLDLLSSCVGVVCGAELTCADGACSSVQVDPETLRELDGGSGRLDACGSDERCNLADDDCDGRIDEGFALMTDETHCGRCGNACSATQSCVAGTCRLTCPVDRGDCDGNPTNGCERDLATALDCGACEVECLDPTPLCGIVGASRGCVDACRPPAVDRCGTVCVDLDTSPLHCGSCGRACPTASRAQAECSVGECGMRCDPGYGDCDGSFASGCETPLNSLSDCGACAGSCALPHASVTCFTGTCAVDLCAPGWGDCDMVATNGCESALNTASNCGTCGTACAPANATASCATGICNVGACNSGFGDCNASRTDGCESDLTSVTSCGGCGRACVLPNATPRCAAGAACDIAACDVGWADCNRIADDGCETSLTTLANCGTCGRACELASATESCGTGSCLVASCAAGFGDCNATPADGCEVPLTTASDCGTCRSTCMPPTPLCVGGAAPACGGACTGAATLCGTSCVDLSSDASHCGACASPCALDRATAQCVASACTVLACDGGHADCNGVPADGCEVRTNTLDNCRTCGATCSLANAIASCATDTCAILSCAPGFRDCDGVSVSGCERSVTTLSDCGGCGAACDLANASETCTAGACTLGACAAAFSDCNGLSSDGCEVSLTTLTNCGTCGELCDLANADESCATGTCAVTTCSLGFGDCDGVAANGCEASLSTLTNCGACGAGCGPLAAATATCASGTCAVATCSADFGDCDALASNGCERALTTLTDCAECAAPCALANGTESCASGSCRITTCDASRGNCDGIDSNGCEANLLVDPARCGTCMTSCTTGGCSAGVCSSGSCPMGLGDCDMDGLTCERSLTTLTDCGACGAACDLANAGESCTSGVCALGACTGNFGDCNLVSSDGCETSLRTVTNCGACMGVCDLAHASETCSGGGTCAIGTCETGWGNCDGSSANGCERPLDALTSCGGCMTTCSPGLHTTSPTCATGVCAFICDPSEWRNCDGLLANGCEVNTNTDRRNCGTCGFVCPGGGSATCTGGSCT